MFKKKLKLKTHRQFPLQEGKQYNETEATPWRIRMHKLTRHALSKNQSKYHVF